MTCEILEPQTGIKLLPPELEEWSFKQWTARKVQKYSIYPFFFSLLPTSYSTHLLSHLPESISLELPFFKFIISILPILAYTDKCFSHLLT